MTCICVSLNRLYLQNTKNRILHPNGVCETFKQTHRLIIVLVPDLHSFLVRLCVEGSLSKLERVSGSCFVGNWVLY